MVKFVKSFVMDESGASAAEYALILAIVGSGIAFAAVTLGGAITGAIGEATNCINNPPASATAVCAT
jgi:pilus assembly protein Flp/PilA